jgi:hypothetical protein
MIAKGAGFLEATPWIRKLRMEGGASEGEYRLSFALLPGKSRHNDHPSGIQARQPFACLQGL